MIYVYKISMIFLIDKIISGNYFISGTLGFTAFGDGSGIIEGVVNNNNLPSNIVNRSNGEATPYIFNNEIRQ